MTTRRAAGRLLLASLLSACGGTPTTPTSNLSGQWQGIIESAADGAGTITFQLTQSGLNVEGTVRLTQGGIADVSGTLTGTLAKAAPPTTMQYVVTYQYGPFQCQGTFSGISSVTRGEMAGSFNGQNCVRTFAGLLRVARGDAR
ncbi:MAG TPA: hypothetical protein VH458_06470 [Vicinamibacterales bacterium]|jgi:hypothetical protein